MAQEDDEKSLSSGLVIQGADFAMKAYNEATDLYDLYLLKVVNKGKENQKYELRNFGYGMTMYRCFKKIIQYRVTKRKSTFTGKGDDALKEFLKIYKEEEAKLFAAFDFTPEELECLEDIKQVRMEAREKRVSDALAIKAAEKAAKKAAKKAEKTKEFVD